MTLSGATTPGQREPGNDSNGQVICIPQSSNITGTLRLYCLVSYPGFYSSAEKQLVYSIAPAD